MIKFGTDGWRDLMSADFNEQNVQRVATAIAGYVMSNDSQAANGIVIGFDTRNNSERFSKIFAQILRNNNIKVIEMTRPSPTPVTAYAVKRQKAFGAVMITASHNPPDYNGVKFISETAGPANQKVTATIEEFVVVTPEQESIVQVVQTSDDKLYDPFIDYREHLKTLIDYEAIRKSGIKVVIDPIYGAGYGLLDQILQVDAGLEVSAINNYPDPQFGGGMPEPAGDNLKRLSDEVQKQGADVGLALDGDGDRFAVVDSTGFSPTPNLCISLLAEHLIDRGFKGKIVRTVATSHMLDRIASERGLETTETKVGFKYIAQEMLKDHVLIGGEESGGVSIGDHIPEKDGILGNLLMIEALAYKNLKSVRSLADDLFAKYGDYFSRRVDLHLSQQEKEATINKLQTFDPGNILGFEIKKIYKDDGFKFYLDNGSWLMIRPSGTEPVLRIYAESFDEQSLEDLLNYAKDEIVHTA